MYFVLVLSFFWGHYFLFRKVNPPNMQHPTQLYRRNDYPLFGDSQLYEQLIQAPIPRHDRRDITELLMCMIKHDTTDDILNNCHPYPIVGKSLFRKFCFKKSTNDCVRDILTHMSQDREQLTPNHLDVFCDTFNDIYSHKQANTEIQKEKLEFVSLVCKKPKCTHVKKYYNIPEPMQHVQKDLSNLYEDH